MKINNKLKLMALLSISSLGLASSENADFRREAKKIASTYLTDASVNTMNARTDPYGLQDHLIDHNNFIVGKDIKNRLQDLGLNYFIEQTNIINNLQKAETPIAVALTIELAYADYYENLEKSITSPRIEIMIASMEKLKPLIYKTILKDYPAALAELEPIWNISTK